MKKFFSLFLFIFFGYIILINGQADRKYWHPLSNSVLLTLEGGSAYSFTDYEKSDLGILLGGNLEYYFPTDSKNAFGLSLRLGKSYLKGNTNNFGLMRPADIFNTEATTIGLDFLYSYAIDNTILPFVSVGVSYYLMSFESENVNSSFIGSDLLNGGEKNSLVIDASGGAKFKVSDDFTINAKIGYNYVLNDNIDALEIGDYKDYYLSGSLGFSFRIWNERDTDGDGISDDVDKCPYKEEDIDGFQDEDGCPDLDNDGDGILDIDDACQNIAEDLDGFQDEDGCPDLDNDGDGINDKDDPCPNVAEDFDGYQDDDGCPDADNDGDGITDDKDSCVNEAEVFNGYQDDDGCPDELPKPIIEEPKPKIEKPIEKPKPSEPKPTTSSSAAPSQFLIHSETTFSGNTNQIKTSAYGELNGIVDQIKRNPNVNWRIEAHIDKQNSSSEAKSITRSQADAILTYFISKGLPSFNFEVMGFGDINPIASNNTVYGRMKNKRIIIRKID